MDLYGNAGASLRRARSFPPPRRVAKYCNNNCKKGEKEDRATIPRSILLCIHCHRHGGRRRSINRNFINVAIIVSPIATDILFSLNYVVAGAAITGKIQSALSYWHGVPVIALQTRVKARPIGILLGSFIKIPRLSGKGKKSLLPDLV